MALELVPGIPAVGRVLDVRDRTPIIGATIEGRLLDGLGRYGLKLKGDAQTNEEGRFLLAELAAEGGAVSVSAEGFHTRVVVPAGGGAGVLSFGDVLLEPEREVVLRLLAIDNGEVSASSYLAGILPQGARDAGSEIVWFHFDAKGEVSVPLQGSWSEVYLQHLNGTVDVYSVLHPEDSDTTIDLPVLPRRTLVVRRAGDQTVEGTLTVFAGLGNGMSLRRRFEASTRTEWSGPAFPSEHVEVTWIGLDDEGYLEQATLPVDANQEIVLDRPAADFQVEVIDEKGLAIAGAQVELHGSSLKLGQVRSYVNRTGDDGCAYFHRWPGVWHVTVIGPAGGGTDSIPLDPTATVDSPMQVVLHRDQEVSFRFEDRGDPLAGVKVRFLDTWSTVTHSEQFTGVDGVVRIAGMERGSYVVLATREGFFPYWESADLPAAEPLVVVPMLRTGSVVLDVEGADGVPIVGASVQLHHLGRDHTYSLWRSAGLVSGPDPQTDGNGQLAIDGLAEGRYRVEVTVGEETSTAEFDLEPGEGVSWRIRAP